MYYLSQITAIPHNFTPPPSAFLIWMNSVLLNRAAQTQEFLLWSVFLTG